MMVKVRECENPDCPVVRYRTVVNMFTEGRVNHACPACSKVGRAVG